MLKFVQFIVLGEMCTSLHVYWLYNLSIYHFKLICFFHFIDYRTHYLRTYKTFFYKNKISEVNTIFNSKTSQFFSTIDVTLRAAACSTQSSGCLTCTSSTSCSTCSSGNFLYSGYCYGMLIF